MIVADTDVLIDALRGRDPFAHRIAQAIQDRALATTVITTFELLSGARTESERKKVEKILGPLPVFPLDAESSRLAASIRLELEREGRGIGMADYLIAAICLTRSHTLLTRNRSHFERISRLALA